MLRRKMEAARDQVAPFDDHQLPHFPKWNDDDIGMPLGLPTMTDEEISILATWIAQGCEGPEKESGVRGVFDGYLVPDGPIAKNKGCEQREPESKRPQWAVEIRSERESALIDRQPSLDKQLAHARKAFAPRQWGRYSHDTPSPVFFVRHLQCRLGFVFDARDRIEPNMVHFARHHVWDLHRISVDDDRGFATGSPQKSCTTMSGSPPVRSAPNRKSSCCSPTKVSVNPRQQRPTETGTSIRVRTNSHHCGLTAIRTSEFVAADGSIAFCMARLIPRASFAGNSRAFARLATPRLVRLSLKVLMVERTPTENVVPMIAVFGEVLFVGAVAGEVAQMHPKMLGKTR